MRTSSLSAERHAGESRSRSSRSLDQNEPNAPREPLEPLAAEAIRRLATALDRHGVPFARAAAIRRPHGAHGRSKKEGGDKEWAMASRRHLDTARRQKSGCALASASGVWMPRDALPTGITVEQLRRSLGSDRFAAQTADFNLNGNSECRLIFFAELEPACSEDIDSWRRVAGRPGKAALMIGAGVIAAMAAGAALLWGSNAEWLVMGRQIARPAVAVGAALLGVAMAAGWMLASLLSQARALDAPALEAETEMDATREVPTGGGEPILAAEAAARRAVSRALAALSSAAPRAGSRIEPEA